MFSVLLFVSLAESGAEGWSHLTLNRVLGCPMRSPPGLNSRLLSQLKLQLSLNALAVVFSERLQQPLLQSS